MLVFWEPIIWTTSSLLEFTPIEREIYDVENFKLLFLGYFIFLIGIAGLLLRTVSVLYIVMSVEIMMLGINMVFLAIGSMYLIIQMPVYVLLMLTLSAAETAVVLGVIFMYHRLQETTKFDILKILKF